MTIAAILNPGNPFAKEYRENDGSILDHHKMRGSGFGLLRFRRVAHTCTFESWPIHDKETPGKQHKQHPGWPKTVELKRTGEK